MADKLDGSAIVANTIPSNRIQSSSITQTQLQPALYTTITQATHPKIRSLTYPGNDTAANTGGGDTIVVNGTGFGNTGNVQIYINGNAVSSITVTNSNSVSFTAPALSAATYPLYLINTSDGSTAILIPGIQYSGVPTWTTTTPLSNQDAGSAWSIQLVATSDSTISYSLQAGSSLPAGITLAANGLISGTMTSPPTDETTYNFTVVANDLEQQDASRAFNVTVTVAVLDPYFTYTTLLLHGDGTNNANNHAFVDSSNNAFAITRNGNASQGTFSPFGDNWSYYFDGTDDYVNVPANSSLLASTGDYTIEGWINPSNTASGMIIGSYPSGTNGNWIIRFNSNKLSLYQYPSVNDTLISASNIQVSQWTHFAVSRSSGTTRLFINGILESSIATSYTLGIAGNAINIGRYEQSGTYYSGYMSNIRYIVGTALYTANFTPPTQPYTSIANTSLLTCQSNAFIDKSAYRHAVSGVNGARVSKFDPFKPYKAIPASYGVYFDGTGDYLSFTGSTSLQFGTGDWTVEFWVLLTSLPTQSTILDLRGGATASPVVFNVFSTYFNMYNGTHNNTTGITPITNKWYHFACVKSGSTTKIYIDGTSYGSFSDSVNYNTGTGTIMIGRGQDASAYYLSGHISNLRVLKGTALYTSNFTPSTSPLTAVANTQLLTCQSTTIIDNSTNAYTITRNGDALPTDLNPFTTTFVSEKYNTANGGGAVYLDGTGDYLSMSDANLAIGSGDFTLECWVYCTTTPSDKGIFEGRSGGTGTAGFTLTAFTGTTVRIYSGSALITSGTINYVGSWCHIAVSRVSGTTTLYVNGISQGTTASLGNLTDSSFVIGAGKYASPPTVDAFFTGYIANFRIIKGRALYTTPFVPLITPPTNVANTSLLCNFTNAGILDSVGKNVLETVGDARVNTSVKKYGTGSMYFDGNGDVLSIVDDEMHRLTSGDFTIECWVYPTANGALYDSGFASYGAATTLAGWFFGMSGTNTGGTLNRLIWSVNYSASGGAPVYGNNGIPLNTWTHAAVTKVGTTINLFINGVLDKTATVTATPTTSTSYKLYIGAASYDPTGTQRSLTGYIDDLRITKGVARYRYNFTPPTKAFNDGDGSLANNTTDVLVGDQVNLPVFPYTTLLLHGDGTNNANNHAFLDSSNNAFTITRNGNATQGTFSPFSPTGWSYAGSTSTSYLQLASNTAIQLGTGDFTVECWAYFTTVGTSGGSENVIMDVRPTSTQGAYFNFGLSDQKVYWDNGTGGSPGALASGAVPLNSWLHIAIVRSSGTSRLYINGTSVASAADSVNYSCGSTNRIGNLSYFSGGDRTFNGYISNLRIVKGTAVYTAAFTPSTSALTAIANTSLLACQSNRFIDNSNNAFALTVNGTPSVQAFSPFAPSVEYTANTHGGSAYFDGTGDYLTGPNNSAVSTSGGNYLTCEAWIYPTSHGSERTVFFRLQLAGSYPGYILRLDNGFPLLGSSSNDLTSNTAAQLNAWNHVAFVFDSSGNQSIYLNGVRTATRSNGPTTMDYSANLIIGGDGTGTRNFFGYIASARIIKQSTPYYSGATITVPTAPLTTITNTSLLLNCTNAGILDSTGKNVLETVGDARVNTATKKYGTGSMYFDGTGDSLDIQTSKLVSAWSDDFTIEGWFYTNSTAAQNMFWANVGTNSSGYTAAYLYTTGQLGIGKAGVNEITSATGIWTNAQWNHLAWVRSGSNLTVYLNGLSVATTTSAATYLDTSTVTGFAIGKNFQTSPAYLNGYVDDFRITRGIARYVQNFTPPTAAFLNK